MTWSGFDPNIDVAAELKKVSDQKKEDKKARFAHEYECARCGKKFTLPVELDRSRPIYCDDCHAIMLEERKARGEKKPAGRTPRPGEKLYPVPPKPSEGEMIPIATPGEASLKDLPERPVAPTVDVKNRYGAPISPEVKHEHVLVPVQPPSAPTAPKAASPAPRPAAQPQRTSSAPATSIAPAASVSGEPAKKKRRRRKKKSGGGGDAPVAASQVTPIVPVAVRPDPIKPASVKEDPKHHNDELANAMNIGALPTPVAPGERIHFDE